MLLLLLSQLQSCPTLCNPIDGSPPGSAITGILQARTLEWASISFTNAWKWKVKVKSLSRVRLFATPWTAAHQVPPSMGFSRREDWSGVPLPSPINNHSSWYIQRDLLSLWFYAFLEKPSQISLNCLVLTFLNCKWCPLSPTQDIWQYKSQTFLMAAEGGGCWYGSG